MEQNENLPQNEEMTATEQEENKLCWSEDTPGALDIYSYPQLSSIKDYMKIAVIYPFLVQIGISLLGFFSHKVPSSLVLFSISCNIVQMLPFIWLVQIVKHALIYHKPNAPFLVKSAFWVSMLFWAITFVSLLMQGHSGVVLPLLLSVIYGYIGLKECGAGELDEVFPDDFRKVRTVDYVLVYDFIAAPLILWLVYSFIMEYFGIVF